jgi:hypothetical protein
VPVWRYVGGVVSVGAGELLRLEDGGALVCC